MNKVSVVILNWNGGEMLFRFLPSVLHWSTMPGVEICVADNGSTDQSVQILQEHFPSVRLILLGENFGYAGGYNRALKQIDSEYVVLLNSDVEVTEDWLEPMMDYLDLHPEIAACQPKILNYSQRDRFEYAGAAGGFIDRYGYPFCRGRIMSVVEKDRGQYNTIISIFWASGAALFIRLEDYRRVGKLDDNFFAHMEEIDLCWRLRARGRGIVCIPQSKVYHLGAATLKNENPQKTFLNFHNNLVMLYKNLPEKEFNRVMNARMVLDYVAALSFLFKGQSPNALAVLRARREYKINRPFLLSIRKENLKRTLYPDIPERKKGCILVWYYLKGKNFFSKLSF
ncbi:N-acetylglucosaminyl-diphospho-decaprenol L-rhamnosyltransferase [termite gut metagenome]|uniref:N-acetylglucosaminyl-diphospho-decaprenol L-rhamnosyltransferase n=3 Tax=termite gut metagenome TaxID=433724 RepID=A0A5J4S609_9ZZZZ